MIRRPPRSTQSRSSAASDVYTRQFLHGEDGPNQVALYGQYLRVIEFLDDKDCTLDQALQATTIDGAKTDILMSVFGNPNPFKGGNKGCAKGKGKAQIDPTLRMVSQAIGTRQSQIYRQKVLTSQTAQQIVEGAREEAALASATPSAAPAVAASSSSGPDVAADHGGTKGAAQGPGGPSGAVGTSSVSKSAGCVSESTATEVPTAARVLGKYETNWASHFGLQDPENRPRSAPAPAQGDYQGGTHGLSPGPHKRKREDVASLCGACCSEPRKLVVCHR